MENQVNILIDILKVDRKSARSLYRGRKLNVTKLPAGRTCPAIAATPQLNSADVLYVA